MATHREQIIAYLQAHPNGADDDQLAAFLDINPRQTVNQICRSLFAAGSISRNVDRYTGKKVNRFVGGTLNASYVLERENVPHVIGRMIILDSEAAVRGFAYPDVTGISEDEIKAALVAILSADGWETDVRWGHVHGIDIAARRGKERLILEAKGEGSRNPMRVNYFLGALGELLQRMESPDARYGVAMPAHRQFVRLILRLPTWIRSHLHLCFYLVRPTAEGIFEVGYIPPIVSE